MMGFLATNYSLASSFTLVHGFEEGVGAKGLVAEEIAFRVP